LDKGVDGFRLDAVAHLAKDLSFSDSLEKPDERMALLRHQQILESA
jgi:glycosidase